MPDFTDEELVAYADERLSAKRCVEVEQSLRVDTSLSKRLGELLSQRDDGDFSVGEIWRKGGLSCPSRSVWAAFVDGRLGDGLTRYLQFHVDTIGCRVCEANLADLKRRDPSTDVDRRTRKIFQSSAGRLPSDGEHS